MKKIYTILLISVLLIVGISGYVFASNSDEGIMPLWDHVSSVLGNLSFSANTGTVYITVYGNEDVTKIDATARLYYQNERGRWVKTSTAWNYSVNSDELAINETFAAESGKTYRVLLSASVYVGDTKEAVLEEFIGKY